MPEVSDIVATLRVLDSPTASDALVRTLTSPRWRIGPQDLVALGDEPGPWRVHRSAQQRHAADGRRSGTGTGAPRQSSGARPGPADQPGSPVKPDDFLTRAVADFTAEAGSLVEALDDLGDPSAYSEPGMPA